MHAEQIQMREARRKRRGNKERKNPEKKNLKSAL